MGDRGRKSAKDEERKTVEKKRPEPPKSLTPTQAKRWRAIVDDYAPDHFRPADLGLLASYIRLEDMVRIAEEKKININDPLSDDTQRYLKLLIQLERTGTKLRLLPSTRIRQESAKVNKPGGKRPWER